MATKHENKNAKTFVLELYEEDPTMHFAIDYMKNCPYSCAYIWHDKDVYDDGTPKKKHMHVVLKWCAKVTISVIAKNLQLASNYIDTCKSETSSLLYLIHKGWLDKYQYDPDEVQGNGCLYTRFKTLVEDEEEGDRVLRILKILDDNPYVLSMRDFIKLCCEAGCYPELRRGGYLIAQALKEHNEEYA